MIKFFSVTGTLSLLSNMQMLFTDMYRSTITRTDAFSVCVIVCRFRRDPLFSRHADRTNDVIIDSGCNYKAYN